MGGASPESGQSGRAVAQARAPQGGRLSGAARGHGAAVDGEHLARCASWDGRGAEGGAPVGAQVGVQSSPAPPPGSSPPAPLQRPSTRVRACTSEQDSFRWPPPARGEGGDPGRRGAARRGALSLSGLEPCGRKGPFAAQATRCCFALEEGAVGRLKPRSSAAGSASQELLLRVLPRPVRGYGRGRPGLPG